MPSVSSDCFVANFQSFGDHASDLDHLTIRSLKGILPRLFQAVLTAMPSVRYATLDNVGFDFRGHESMEKDPAFLPNLQILEVLNVPADQDPTEVFRFVDARRTSDVPIRKVLQCYN
ncbi:hypothetical protein NMY22_g13137 [Coprinellus aureogranulatus]|nr:hypothetical protein NMY22_g13137 [Coprinellus aureogranulatus]